MGTAEQTSTVNLLLTYVMFSLSRRFSERYAKNAFLGHFGEFS